MTISIFIAIIYPLYILYRYIYLHPFLLLPRNNNLRLCRPAAYTRVQSTPTGDERKFGSMHIYNYFIAVIISLPGILYTIKWHCRLSNRLLRGCVFL